MAADPKPCDFVCFEQAYRSVPESHSNRVDRFSTVNLLELQAGMVWILSKQPVRLARGVPDVFRKIVVRCPEARCRARVHRRSGSRSVGRSAVRSARASAASLLSRSCEAQTAGPTARRRRVREAASGQLGPVRRAKAPPASDRGVQRAGHGRQYTEVSVSADVSPRADSLRSDERSSCPECLQNAGRTERNREDASGRSHSANRLQMKRLSPEVTRHHQLEKTR